MSSNGLFSFTGFTGFDDNNLYYNNSGAADDPFSAFNNTGLDLYTHQHADPSVNKHEWYLRSPNAGGPSQPYTGVEALEGPSSFPDLDDPLKAPTSLWPANRVSLDEGHNSPFYSRMGILTFSPQLATTPLPPTDPIPSPVVHPSSPHVLPREEAWGQVSDPGPSGLASSNVIPLYPIMGAPPPMVPLPAPIASSSGPQRTGKHTKGSRKHNPVKSTKDSDEGENGWDTILVQFQVKLHDIVHNGQPPGGLSPETALAAKISKTAKEDLKRSPLRDAKAGEGERPRNVEDYLTGLLGEIIPAKQASNPGQGRSKRDKMRGAVFARLADALELKLEAVNQQSALREPTNDPRTGRGARREQTEDRVKKNEREKSKRDYERYHLERISHLFRVVGPQQTWTRVDVLSFAIVFLLCGHSAFSTGFVKVAPKEIS